MEQVLEKPLQAWTKKNVFEWINYLPSDQLPDKIRMALVEYVVTVFGVLVFLLLLFVALKLLFCFSNYLILNQKYYYWVEGNR